MYSAIKNSALEMAASSSEQATERAAISFTTDVELKSVATVQDSGPVPKTELSGVFAPKRERWSQVKSCLFRKSCAVYTLIIAFTWLFVAHNTDYCLLFSEFNGKLIFIIENQ